MTDTQEPTQLTLSQVIEQIGQTIMGSLWGYVYETIQDAIALSILFQIPNWIGKLILKADYSGFDQCVESWNIWNVNRYACFVMVGSSFLLWITIAGRILARTIKSFSEIFPPESNQDDSK